MFATFVSTALLAATLIRGVAADFSVSTPGDIAQCADLKMSWDQTSGPYNVVVVDAADPCGDIKADLGDHDGNHITWAATLPVGEYVLSIEDGSGDEGWSGSFQVTAGTDLSCLPSSSLPSSSASPSVTLSGSSAGSTLTVTPSSTAKATSSSSAVVPVGAAGADPVSAAENGAMSARPISALVLGVVAVVAFAL